MRANPAQAKATPQVGFDALLDVLTRRRYAALFSFAGTLTAVVSVVAFLPDVYRSSATVLIERQQIPEEMVRATVTSALETRLQMISQEILSRSKLEDLIARFDLYPELKRSVPIEKVVEKLRGDIWLDLKGGQQGGSDRATVAFVLSYNGPDPHTVAAVTNALATSYVEENLKARERQATGTASFLRGQLEETRKKLERLEAHVSAFKERYMGFLPEQLQANLTTLEQLNVQLRVNADSQDRNTERRNALEKQLVEAQGTGPAGVPKTATERLAVLQRTLTDLRTRYSDKYPDVIRAEAEIAALQEQIARDTELHNPEAIDPSAASMPVQQLRRALSDLDVEAASLKAEEQNLRRSIAVYQGRVEQTPEREQQFKVLSRDYEATQELFRSLTVRQREAELAENMEQRQKGEQFRIIEPAQPAQYPAAPHRARLLGFGLLLSLGLAAGLVMVLETLDSSIRSAEALRALTSLPVLVTIPRIVTEADRHAGRGRVFAATALSAIGLLAIVIGSYFLARVNGPLTAFLLK